MVELQKYKSIPLEVEAVEVTVENFHEVEEWCKGEIRTALIDGEFVRYVKVPVKRPRNQRQTKAFVGDWILKTPATLKVYTPAAFNNNFVLLDS